MQLPGKAKSDELYSHFYTFLLLSLIIFVFETFLPRPMPWIKLGLANMVIVVGYFVFPPFWVFKLVIYRVIIGAVFLGTIGSPSLILSLAGGICAYIAMSVWYYMFKNRNFVVLSIHGAVAHFIGQVIVLYLFYIPNYASLYILPYLIFGGTFSGLIVGLLAGMFYDKIVPSEVKQINHS
ncbi:MAG: Gx transporter family protein [Calditrichia bacterium]